MTRLSKFQKSFLRSIPKDGDAISNSALRDELGWSDLRYWNMHARLVASGHIKVGRGQGGTVFIPQTSKRTKAKTQKRVKEQDLYAGFVKVLEQKAKEWVDAKSPIIEITANQGAKETGGRWSRPDVTMVSISKYIFTKGKVLDVTTFELKLAEALNVSAVYEAVEQSKGAHRSFFGGVSAVKFGR